MPFKFSSKPDQIGSTQPLNTAPLSCGNLSAVMTNVSGTCYTSVLTIPTPQYYNGTTVQCADTSLNTVGNVTLNVQLACKLSLYNVLLPIATAMEVLVCSSSY